MIDAAYDPIAGLLNLVLSVVLILLVVGLSAWRGLGVEKDVIIASFRAVVQLMAVVLVIVAVFEVDSPFLTVSVLIVMVIIAAKSSAERASGMLNPFSVTFPAIGSGAGTIIFILVILGVLPVKPEFLIPVGSMAIGGTMIVCSLVLNRYSAELKSHKDMIETALSLGASDNEALMTHIRQSVRASLIPSLDRMRSLGIVVLPGTMAGMIIGGVNPIWAAEYQLVIMFMIFSSEVLAALVAVSIAEKKFDFSSL
jgi:putative ABC transport system permease protein